MNVKRSTLVIIFCCLASIPGLAQDNEFSLSVGAMHSSDQRESLAPAICPPGVDCNVNTSTSTGVAIEGTYARKLLSFGGASLDFELPLVGVPRRDTRVSQLGLPVAATISSWSVFLTPSARIRLLPDKLVSPFVSVGGGWAHYNATANITAVAPVFPGAPQPAFSFSSAADHGVLQFGGGVDFNLLYSLVLLRAEVRDFWGTGIAQPATLVQVSPAHQHNIFAAGGVVLRF